MSQRKNTVQLNPTAMHRLQARVDSGEFLSCNDAANHIILSVPTSTAQYSPVLTKNESLSTDKQSVRPSTSDMPIDKLRAMDFD